MEEIKQTEETVTQATAEPQTEPKEEPQDAPASEIAALEKKLAEAEAALEEQKDKYLRMMAEYDNYRKRAAKDRENIYADAYTDVLKEILPVADNLERAASFSDGAQIAEGVKMTAKQLTEAFRRLGIEEIPCETFDPVYHNAVMHVEDESLGENTVTEVFQKGYKKGDRVLRCAMVKVAN